ncbi:MAG: tetratricopeptide repeat protein [Chloroflexi bacterium]|nr:tetratricopeptide repeat protein [Chloroflexota bacterium]
MNRDVGELLGRIKLKNTNVIGVILAVVGFVACGVGFFQWRSAQDERVSMESQYEVTQASIAQVEKLRVQGPQALRERLASLQAEAQALWAEFPTSAQVRTELSGYYNIAMQFNTYLVRLEALIPPGQASVSLPYGIETYAIEANGAFADLLRFLAAITQSTFKTFVFENLTITRDSPAVAKINLTVFTAATPAPNPAAEGPWSAPALSALPEGQITPSPISVSPGGWLIPSGANASLEASRYEQALWGAWYAQDWPTAIAYGERLLALAPGRSDIVGMTVEAYARYGRDLAAAGRVDMARQQFLTALRLDPANATVLAELTALGVPVPKP